MCWTLLHICLLKLSGLSKTPGGGKITLDFIAKILAGANGAGLFTSLIVSTVDGREFNIDLHLVDSSSKLSNLHPLNPKKSLTLGFCSKHASTIPSLLQQS